MLLNYFLQSTGVSSDTRTVKEGNIFFALKGDNFDGNDYIHVALDQGALMCVSDTENESIRLNPKVLFVPDVLLALQNLARDYRRHINKPVLALTGSNGKTTTKELINVVLQKKFKVHCTKGNYNNHIGVPLTILDAKEGIDMMLIEMGANHQGEIDALCKIAEPNFGLITNVGKAHLEGFGGVEGVKKGKSEIYRHIKATRGIIFCNENDRDLVSLIPEGSNVHFYSVNQEAVENLEHLEFFMGKELVKTNLFGSHNIPNVVAAIEIGIYFGIPMDVCIQAVKDYYPENNRSQISHIDGRVIIKDAYNSNPTSLTASLLSLIKSYQPKKTVVIIGDMLELGEYSEVEHNKIIDLLRQYDFLDVWLIGQEFKKANQKSEYHFYGTTEEAKQFFSLINYPSDTVVFLKGSRGIAVEKLILDDKDQSSN